MENQQGKYKEQWKVNSVVRTITRDKSIIRPQRDKIPSVMVTLKTDRELRFKIREKCHTMDTVDIWEDILSDWKSRESSNATISALVDALEKCELRNTADEVRKEHGAEHLQNTEADDDLKLKTPQSPAIHKIATDVAENIKPEPEKIPLCKVAEIINDEVRDKEGNNSDNYVLNAVKSKVGRWLLVGCGAFILLTIVLIVIFTVGGSRSNSYNVATTLVPQNEQKAAAPKTILSQNVQNVGSNASIIPQNVQKVAAPAIIVIVSPNVQKGVSNTTSVPKIAPKVPVTKKNASSI